MPVPWLSSAYLVEQTEKKTEFPFTLPFVRTLDLALDDRITVFAGENGSGKSTLIEALAELVGLPWDGGGESEFAASEMISQQRLAHFMRPRIRNKAPNKFFFRAEALSDFAHLLEERKADPWFMKRVGVPADPYELYGGKSLRTRSHGEAMVHLLTSHDRPGLYFFDEPESALSPRAQTHFVKILEQRLETNQFQFVIATHSPIIMSIRRARIVSFDGPELRTIRREESGAWKTYAAFFK